MNILKQEPVFNLKINTFGTKYFVVVNGVAVLTEFSAKSQLTTSIPINQWMHPKDNRFGLYILPENPGEKFNPHSYVELQLMITENSHREKEYSIPILHFSGEPIGQEISASIDAGNYELSQELIKRDEGAIQIGEIDKRPDPEYQNGYIYSRNIVIENSMPLWKFFESDELPDYYSMSDEQYYASMDSLFVEYMKVQDALASRDIKSILPMFEERNREIDAAFYLESGTTAQRIKESLEEDVNNPELNLAELKRDYVDITLEDNRKLVSLLRKGFTNAIGLDFKTGGSTSYPMMFRRENGKWILTR